MKMKILLSIVAVAASTFAVFQTSRISGLKERVAEAERKRLDFVKEMLWSGEKIEVVGVSPESAYRKAAEAYQSRDLVALRTSLYSLPAYPDVKMPLRFAFDDSFLRAKRLLDFNNVDEFECFAWANTDVAMFYGRLYERSRKFEMLTCIEELSFLRFKSYREKFHAEGRKDLEQTAKRFMDLWVAHIESPEGFTRIGIRGMIKQQTELVDAARPGCGMSQEGAISLGRAMSIGLVRCGYTPKWLDEEFPAVPVSRHGGTSAMSETHYNSQ